MTPYWSDEHVTLHHGDALAILPTLDACSVDAVVTDPPYALGFMGKAWDTHTPAGFQAWCQAWATECLRVLKPGGHLVAFGGTRTWHRLACAIEDAGFEMRDSIAWLYGSGFPKSLDVSKAIDKATGATRADLGPGQWAHVKAGGTWNGAVYGAEPAHGEGPRATAPATDDARTWQGWGTALKPAHEPIVVARKPIGGVIREVCPRCSHEGEDFQRECDRCGGTGWLTRTVGTVAANVLAHGTGALNVDGCRVETTDDLNGGAYSEGGRSSDLPGAVRSDIAAGMMAVGGGRLPGRYVAPAGRWPPNVLLDGDAADALDEQSGNRPGMATQRDLRTTKSAYFGADKHPGVREGFNDEGGASRFFPTFRYEAKAPTAERPRDGLTAHPTVKPLDLMRWLVRLVTPPGGRVLDCFAGSGTTGEACIHEHMRAVLIEREADYLPLIVARLTRPLAVGFDFGEPA